MKLMDNKAWQPNRFLGGAILAITMMVPASFSSMSAVAQVSLPDAVETQSLKADALSTGVLSQREGALPASLWNGSDSQTLEFLLDHAPRRPDLPAIGEALRRTLLSSGEVPPIPDDTGIRSKLGGKKLLALVNAGFIEEARTIASLSDAPRNDPDTGKALALADLLMNQEAAACTRGAGLNTSRADPFWVKLRAFCYAISGERDAADLTLSLLRDQGALAVRDEEFLVAMVAGVQPRKPLHPQTPLELAIARKLNQPLSAGLLTAAGGAVVRAIVDDTSLETSIRVEAARKAVAMGIMSGRDYGALLASIPLDVGVVGDPAGALRRDPAGALTDAVVWQAVQSMSAPEFLRDKAALIAEALGAGDSFEHGFALNSLYAEEVAALEGALIPQADAARFARARMSAGDGEGAGRWLFVMKGEESIAALGDELGAEFIHLAEMLSLLDPVSAAVVADRAGIALTDPRDQLSTPASGSGSADHDTQLPVALTEMIFDAVMGDEQGRKKTGQAALASLALAGQGIHKTTPVQMVVMQQALTIAGLDDIRRKLALQTVWKASAPKTAQVPRAQQQQEDDGLTPSLKPNRRT